MWWGSGPDPGGEGPSKDAAAAAPPANQQLLDLQEQFQSQQTLIAQLKEMLKKTEHSSSGAREKAEEYASALSQMNARAKRSKLRKAEQGKPEEEANVNLETVKEAIAKKSTYVVTPAKEKVNLLRQQLAENRLKLAQRDKNQKGIEEMVNQLKAQLDDSQIMISQSSINLPKVQPKTGVASTVAYTPETPKEELLSLLRSKDTQLDELNSRLQQAQGHVLDLQENLKEKDSVINARTKAITLLSENLSKKGKNTLDMLDETKEQMRCMQEQFVVLESNMKEENAKLLLDLNDKNNRIEDLMRISDSLNEEKNALQSSCADLQKRLDLANTELSHCKLELSTSELKVQDLESSVSELRSKGDLESSLERSERSASSSPQRAGKKSKAWKKSKQKTIAEPKQPAEPSDTESLTRIADLEKLVASLKAEHDKLKSLNQAKESDESGESESLKKQLEAMNKNMIKTKAQYKAKLKDLQKKATPGEINERILILEAENVKLEQRIAELEEEKGNLQLRLVDVDVSKDKEKIADLENKIEEQKMEIENHIRTITILETQITDKSTEISSLRTELANLMHIENAQVCSEMTSVQLEEQLDKEVHQKQELKDKFEAIVKENESLLERIEDLNKEKQEMNTKLVSYMQENMELMDRLEKSSAEKVSSAESIEIVESLTQQEKLEIEAYQKSLDFIPDKESIEPSDFTTEDPNVDLNESVTKLTEDSSELLERIELFTVERREVMEKMDSLLSEKEHLLGKIDKLEHEKSQLLHKLDTVCGEKEQLVQQVDLMSQDNIGSKFDETDGIRMDSTSNSAVIEEYQLLIENQKLEIAELKQELQRKSEESSQSLAIQNNLVQISKEKEGLEIIISSMNEQFLTLRKEYDSFLFENQNLKDQLEGKLGDVHDRQDYNVMKQQLIDFEKKVSEDMEEINVLQALVEDNKNELIKSADYISSLKNELSLKQSELASHQGEIDHLHNLVLELNSEIERKSENCENHIETIDLLSAQLQELKTIMNDNFKALEKYEELNDRLSETEQILELKVSEIVALRKEKSNNENRIISLEEELEHKNVDFKDACEKLRERCSSLESKIQANAGSLDDMKGPFETKINQLETECKKLETKNKELVDKMKKIAANLKKKNGACKLLEAKLAEVSETWENECKEKYEKNKIIEEQQKTLAANKDKINSLLEQLKEMESELNTIQLKLERKNSEYGQLKIDYDHHIQEYENEKSKLHSELSEYTTLSNTLQTEKISRDNEIQKLNAQIGILKIESETNKNDTAVQSLQQQIQELHFNFNTSKNAMEAKIQEKDMYIENIESENVTLKEKLARLNEGLLQVEERRLSLEQRALKLGAELEAKATACEEVSLSENFLENRLAALITRDEVIEKKLKEITITNQTLNDKIDNLTEDNLSLQGKLSETEIKLREKENECEKMISLENDSLQLREVISSLEHDIKKLHLDYEKKLFEKISEVESMEQELNNQIAELNNERKIAINRCEVLEEKIQDFCDNEQVMSDEINDLKQKLSDAKTDLDKQLLENDKLNEINLNSMLSIEQLQNQLSCIQPVETDMQSMHTEITRLHKLISEKDNDIQNYQRQNIQLQMSISNAPSPFDFPSDSLAKSKADSQDIAALQKQLHDLTNELKVSEEKMTELEKANSVLESRIEAQHKNTVVLQEELLAQKEILLRKTAEHHVDEIICTASKTVFENKSVNTESIEIQEAPIGRVVVQNVKAVVSPSAEDTDEQELLKKIKALEFMLYTVEKEKEDAVAQCHSLSNELTRLIYEREGLIGDITKKTEEVKEVDLSMLEGEIVTEADMVDSEQAKKELNVLEFAPVQKVVPFDSSHSVEEDVIKPKSTYLCFSDDKKQPEITGEASGWGIDDGGDEIIKDTIESHIIHESSIQLNSPEAQELQLFEFEKVQMPGTGAIPRRPVDLCYPGESANMDVRDAFAGEEDGWGWNAEEVKLEVKHQEELSATQTTVQAVQPLDEELREKVRVLEEEKTKLLEDFKAQQIKAVKFVKKLKDMKTKNEKLAAQLQQKSMGEFDVLDMAIQDELNIQITNLEGKLKENNEEKAKDKAEKENLLKRIDTLTGANERMIEMKEKQDNEIQMLQFNNRQLSSKLEQLEWGDDSPKKITNVESIETLQSSDSANDNREIDELNLKINELNAIVNDLTIDNEEMQLLLEEQRKLRLEAEKALSSMPVQENMKTEQEYMQLKTEKEQINHQLLDLMNEKKTMNEKIMEYSKVGHDLCSRLDQVQEKIKALTQEKDSLSAQYTLSLEELQKENKQLNEQINNMVLEAESTAEQTKQLLETEMNRHREELSKLEKDNVALAEKENTIIELNNLIEKLNIDKNSLEIKLREISGVICSGNADQLEGLGEKLEIIVKEIQDKNKEVSELNNILNLERAEFEQKLTVTLEQLAQEWAQRVEQRGNDVAESWKLHVEARETEFIQIEQNLRLELTSIYSKNEAVSSENNELHKKLELLLQEKQAAASDNKTEALQQILTERQSEIISLSQQFQDVTVQLEVKNNELISLQQVIDTIQKTNHELVEKIEVLRTNCKEFQQLNLQLENENIDLKKHSKQIEELNSQLKIEIHEYETLKGTVNGLREELSKVREDLGMERLKCSETDNRVIHLEDSIQKYELRLQELINSVDGAEMTTFDESFDRVLYLQQRISQITLKLQQIEQEKEQLIQNHQLILQEKEQVSLNQYQLLQERDHVIQNQQLLLQEKEQSSYEKTILQESNNQLNISLNHIQQMNDKLMTELSDLREQTRTLEIDLNESTQSRNVEINEMSSQIKELECRYQDQLFNKNSEIEALQKQLHDSRTKDTNIANLHLQLQEKVSQIAELESKINELNSLSAEEARQMDELRQVLEQQTAEIEDLKQDLEKKNDDYNAVVEELDNLTELHKKRYATPVHEKHVHFREPLESKSSVSHQEHAQPLPPARKISTDSEDLEPVNRAELDLALYVLHQRDVRCEELTVELMQLLEERDTLQLKLSNAIRLNEELRGKISPKKSDALSEDLSTPKVTPSTGAVPKSKSPDIALRATGTELATDTVENVTADRHNTEEKQELDNKLSQLRSVGYRDKTLKDDQESRFLQQMSIMQQHRDLASRLPAEAAAKLVDASYTLSRDVQSPSKVLLNWLWGKSTPKVNDI